MVLYLCSERSALLEYSRLDLQDVLFLLRGRSVPISFCSEQKTGPLLSYDMIPFVTSSPYVMLLYLVFNLND